MQQNTRYILVILGLGGWQPFDATYVAQNRYGDCKALSNYMISILKEAGINAKYVLVTSGIGKKGLWPDFPVPYFTHAIMCVPNGKDTTWLECTSQTKSAGYMGSFTGDRNVLLIDEDGGHVVHTPIYKTSDNLRLRKVTAAISENGGLFADVYTTLTGLQQETQHNLIHHLNNEERDKYLNSAINLPTYKVEKSSYQEHKGKIPAVDEYLQISSPNYASVSGKRIFIEPNLFNKESKLPLESHRKYEIEIKESYRHVDTVDIKIPAGYAVESMPKEVNIQNKFGTYKITYQFKDNQIHLIREREVSTNTFPASDYSQLLSFNEDICKADRAKMVLVKQ